MSIAKFSFPDLAKSLKSKIITKLTKFCEEVFFFYIFFISVLKYYDINTYISIIKLLWDNFWVE